MNAVIPNNKGIIISVIIYGSAQAIDIADIPDKNY